MKKKQKRLSTIENKKKILEKLSLDYSYTITRACKETGISRVTYYRWLKEDTKFRKKVDDIEEAELALYRSILI